ncbi:hypothetical protein BD410DRAFT_895307 [Rickenella mellea]|uniref:Uncharacterized protein n=1 Tax=Rickenella mellea TaxID=50990 RepID=A0A4Y7QHI2_9AGAM|nr:hypothetical protein BD410DRAFT_895307 [Rickenella mellea]
MSRSQNPQTPTTEPRISRYPRLWNSKSLANQLKNVTDRPHRSSEKGIYIRTQGKIQKISIIYPSSSNMARLPDSGETLYQFLYGVRVSKSNRMAHLDADPDILQFSERTCVCRACGRMIRSETASAKSDLLWNWTNHRTTCTRLQALLAAETSDTGRQDTAPSGKITEATRNPTTSKYRKTKKRLAPSNSSTAPRKKTCHRPRLQSSDDEHVAAEADDDKDDDVCIDITEFQREPELHSSDDEYVATAADDDKDDDVYLDITEYQREQRRDPSTRPRINKSNRAKSKVSIPPQTNAVPCNYFNPSCTPEEGHLMNMFFKP